jgi:hypothetical protein
MNCIYLDGTTEGGYCVTAVTASAGSENKLVLNWIPIAQMTGTVDPTATVVSPAYTYGSTTTGLDQF